MRYALLLSFLFLLIYSPVYSQTYKNPNAPIEERVEDLLGRMTIPEKIGQMTQLNITLINPSYDQNDVVLVEEEARTLIREHHIGSFLNGGAVPPEQWFEYMDGLTRLAVEESRLDIPIIYGVDHVHGANYLGESTVFPQSINLGATFNTEHAYQTGWVTAYEVADIGHHWNFAPILDLGVNPIWARFYETYGEDPYLAAELGEAYVKGLQGNEEIEPYNLAATAKHFLAYSDPASGWDRTPVRIGMQAIHEFHRPPFQAAIDAGAKTVMLNSGEINGIPVHASKEIVTGLLREKMGFDGVVVTDWEDIGKLQNFHKVARDYKEATRMAIEAGIDMSMTPTSLQFNEAMKELVEEGKVTEERIDQSVRRILRLKFELGLFEHPYPRKDRLDRIGSEESAQKSLAAAEESIVLLRNENHVLPLENPKTILVFGPSATSKRNLGGGWTLAWQGGSEDQYPEDMHTVFTALEEEFPNATIRFVMDLNMNATEDEKAELIRSFNSADMLIYVGGEEPYTEFIGNITDFNLPQKQLDEISFISRSDTPLTLVYIGGRPRLVTDVILKTDAFLFAGLPGFEGADAIANILSGETNPSGKLPFSYPQHTGHYIPYNHKSSDTYFFNPDDPNYIAQGHESTALYPFGEGLSYTSFEYSEIAMSDTTLTKDGSITASVKVTNTGDRIGKEAVLWFITDKVGRITRPVKELKKFEKIELMPGETTELTFEIHPMEELTYPNSEGNPILEWGEFTVHVGPHSTDFNLLE